MHPSCHHFYPFLHRFRRRSTRWSILLAGCLSLIFSVAAPAEEGPAPARDLSSDSAVVEAAPGSPASATRVFEVHGAVITWNALKDGQEPLSDEQRAEIAETLRASLATPVAASEAFEEVEVESLENGMKTVRIPLEVFVSHVMAADRSPSQEEE